MAHAQNPHPSIENGHSSIQNGQKNIFSFLLQVLKFQITANPVKHEHFNLKSKL